jgi:hypothetical protein
MMRVIMITQEGGNADCNKPLCCRDMVVTRADKFRAAGKWGDYNCDTTQVLLEDLFNMLKTFSPVVKTRKLSRCVKYAAAKYSLMDWRYHST